MSRQSDAVLRGVRKKPFYLQNKFRRGGGGTVEICQRICDVELFGRGAKCFVNKKTLRNDSVFAKVVKLKPDILKLFSVRVV